MSLRAAARVLAAADAAEASVVDNGEFVGTLRATAVLRVLGQDLDAVTGLPRSGALRDWLTERLASGQEVLVLLLDLDQFGEVNKQHGHTEGDAVLRRAADAIATEMSDMEFAARFGGDEFAIGSIRPREEGELLGKRTLAALARIGIAATCGIAGGRRAAPRKEANVGSTVEELLRMSSLDCMAKKRA